MTSTDADRTRHTAPAGTLGSVDTRADTRADARAETGAGADAAEPADTTGTPGTADGRSAARRPWWAVALREPFLAATWRRVAYVLLALPVSLICVPLALVGGPAAPVQRALAERLLGVRIEAPSRPGPYAFVHAVLSLPLNAIAALVTVYGWSLIPLNLGWPVRGVVGLGDPDPAHDWGGPTFAGAWATHVAGGVGIALLLMPWIGRGLAALQLRLATALLGAGRRGVTGAVGCALAAIAVGCGLVYLFSHQT
ncbi:hypothetical protein [Streptomyces iconiensis]|uniref:Uncharacterized protein n=1 Tax=Streptomyces iconiensis TaxID=1384038 RepID=A0ABT7A6Z0_9ACTN|nr:hypothetical protein [Streptomyces iconiensis]MDJ1137095.1 hypothetical protein [Streptomyces iconiensis]